MVRTGHKIRYSFYSPRNNIWQYKIGRSINKGTGGVKDHPATFPEQLAKDHILTWSNSGDIVLDPFSGSGTTALAAMETGRISIGIEISKAYCDNIVERLKDKEKDTKERLF